MSRLRRRLYLQSLETRAVPAVVNTTGDAGLGSLRQAIIDTNASGADNVIAFDPTVFASAQTIQLESALPAINDNLTLTGPGSAKLTVQRDTAAGNFRVMALSSSGAVRTVGISGLTLTKGSHTSLSQFDNGGGLFIGSHNVTLTDVVISNNTCSGQGGGIGTNKGAVLQLINSTVSGNVANDSFGGGIYFPYDGSLTVLNSTISGNSAKVRGGGVYLYAAGTGTWVFRDSTVSGNKVTNFGSSGGGISLNTNLTGANTLSIQNCTLTLNSVGASGKGGGIVAVGTKSPITLESTIVSGNVASSGTDISSPSGNTVSAKNCALGSKSGILTYSDQGGNLLGAALNLGLLQDNGGPTFTHLPGVGSKAIDAGFNAAGTANDQRGLARTYDDPLVSGVLTVDIGAVEVQPVGIPTAKATATDVTSPGGTSYSFTVTYDDDTAILGATIGAGDVSVTGPNGFTATISYVGVDQPGDGKTRVATYSFNPPGGTWDAADDGVYTISVVAGQVSDTSSNFVAAGAVGTFQALMPRTLVVLNDNDAGAGSLRQAILDANGMGPSADIITFDPSFFATPRTISLTGQFTLSDSVNIVGPGASKLTIDGNNLYRHFTIDGPGMLVVSISGMTLTKGATVGNSVNDRGGSIQINDEDVTLSGLDIHHNTVAVRGGAISLQGAAKLTFLNGNLSNNQAGATYSGGAICSDAPGHVIIVRDSTISGNSAIAGGGIYSALGAVTVERCTISGNTSTDGAGINVGNNNGTSVLTVLSSTIANNTASNQGGGIQIRGAAPNAIIRNSTISGNTANGTAGGGLLIALYSGSVLIQNSTIVFNKSTAASGIAITFVSAGGTVTMDSSILAQNIGDPSQPDLQGTILAHDSLIGVIDNLGAVLDPASTNNIYGDDTVPADPVIGPLADNGGPTQTHALLASSPCIDSGGNPFGLTADQRGLTRVVNGVADIGSFEVQPSAPPPKVQSIVINAADPQRSRVTSIAVNFDSDVTLPGSPASAFQLQRQIDGLFVGLTATVTGTNPTTVTLTFNAALSDFGSLADGRYTLIVFANQVSGPGGQLDGDGNGTGGDNYQLIGNPATNKLYRLYGDADGNGIVNQADFIQFRNSFNAGPSAIFDFDGDGNVTQADFIQFRNRFNVIA